MATSTEDMAKEILNWIKDDTYDVNQSPSIIVPQLVLAIGYLANKLEECQDKIRQQEDKIFDLRMALMSLGSL